MQDSGLGVQLVADDRAADYSEEVFQTLWDRKLEEWMELRAELEEAFDEGQERRLFREGYLCDLEIFRTRTPAKILEKVADIRVLALGFCTAEVYRDFRDYRALCEKWTEKTMEEAWNMQKAQGLDKVWTGGYSLHDSLVQSVKREGEDLVLEFEYDEEASWPEIRGVRFQDAKILKQEGPVPNAWWLYDEIWKTGEGSFEIHALLWRNEDLLELTIECRDTELVWTMEPKAE
jgi:hypothetical protein